MVGQVAQLFRYPVKSLAGEQLRRVDIHARGIAGDRLWSVRDLDGKFGSGKSTRRFRAMPGLLELSAWYAGGEPGDQPWVRFRDGSIPAAGRTLDEALSAYVGRPVHLAREGAVSHFDEGPLHVVTTSALASVDALCGAPVDVRRLRPNLVIDTGSAAGFIEDEWVGRQLEVGSRVVLDLRAPMPRCVMVNLAQPGLDADPHVLHALVAHHHGTLGLTASVREPGTVQVGDEVRLRPWSGAG